MDDKVHGSVELAHRVPLRLEEDLILHGEYVERVDMHREHLFAHAHALVPDRHLRPGVRAE